MDQELEIIKELKVPSYRNYWIAFLLLGFNIIFWFHVGIIYYDLHYAQLRFILPVILLIFFALPTLPLIYFGYIEQKKLLQSNFYRENLKQSIPNFEQIMEMKCIMCEGKIHNPTNMIEHLGLKQTKSYIKFCNETKQSPQLYCCSCYSMVERMPDWKMAYAIMVNNSTQAYELRKQYESKLEWVLSEEQRLKK
jgi:hypothetical protein